MIGHLFGGRKVVDHWFDSRTGDTVVSLGKTLLTYFPLGPSSLPVAVAQPEERLANRTKERCSSLVRLDRRRVPGSKRTNDIEIVAHNKYLMLV